MKTNLLFGCTARSKHRRFRWKLELKLACYCDASKAGNALGYHIADRCRQSDGGGMSYASQMKT